MCMPGARCRKIVQMKLMAPPVDEIVEEDQRERIKVEAHAGRVHAVRRTACTRTIRIGRLPHKKLANRNRPDARKVQYVNALSRGKREIARADQHRQHEDHDAAQIGCAYQKIITVPCIVKTWL